tara:strand:- start:180 stop:614 length:435 start_codon:yes stop_codon:yes gene_type:complete
LKKLHLKKRAVISFDIGLKRIGLAYCDALHITVSILPAINRSEDFSEISLIENYIKKHNIRGIIFGIPLDDKGNITNQAEDCKRYGKRVIGKLNLPFNFVNEHSSTWESINRFGLKKDKSGLVDSYSARIILEQWIKEGPELKE